MECRCVSYSLPLSDDLTIAFNNHEWKLKFQHKATDRNCWCISLLEQKDMLVKPKSWAYPWKFSFFLRLWDGSTLIKKQKMTITEDMMASFSLTEVLAKKVDSIDIQIVEIFNINLLPYLNYSSNTQIHDVVLILQNRKVYQLKAALALKCDYFKSLFFGEFSENGQEEFTLSDIEYHKFVVFLDIFHYGVQLCDHINEAKSALELAAYFFCSSVTNSVEHWLIKNFNPDEFELDHILLADKYRLNKYMKLVMDNWNLAFEKFTPEVCGKLSPAFLSFIIQKLSVGH